MGDSPHKLEPDAASSDEAIGFIESLERRSSTLEPQSIDPESAYLRAKKIYGIWRTVLERHDWMIRWAEKAESPGQRLREISALLGLEFSVALNMADEFVYSGEHDWFPYVIDLQMHLRMGDFGLDAAFERALLAEYLSGRWSAYFSSVLGSPVVGGTPVAYDQFTYWAIENLARISARSGKREHLLLGSVLTHDLAQYSRSQVEVRNRGDFAKRDAYWRTLGIVQDLGGLAARRKDLVERYGEKEIEQRFEEQLGFLFQSFGFLTVSTTRGKRRVDLVCIAPGSGQESYTILVEAKSTRGNYAFPTADSRAVREYVNQTRSLLSTLPQLRLVLVVGPENARTVSGKVKDLESEAGIPVRYCRADLLVALRRGLPGPVSTGEFLKAFLLGESVVTGDVINDLLGKDKKRRNSHASFVADLLSP